MHCGDHVTGSDQEEPPELSHRLYPLSRALGLKRMRQRRLSLPREVCGSKMCRHKKHKKFLRTGDGGIHDELSARRWAPHLSSPKLNIRGGSSPRPHCWKARQRSASCSQEPP